MCTLILRKTLAFKALYPVSVAYRYVSSVNLQRATLNSMSTEHSYPAPPVHIFNLMRKASPLPTLHGSVAGISLITHCGWLCPRQVSVPLPLSTREWLLQIAALASFTSVLHQPFHILSLLPSSSSHSEKQPPPPPGVIYF